VKRSSYLDLPERFYARVSPTAVAWPRLVKFNHSLAQDLGFDPAHINTRNYADTFSGNKITSDTVPIAAAYAGHQFGHFVPQLGDGRAILLGEMPSGSGQLCDLQLKGCGRTPYSRGGDGRAALGPVLREYIVSEAMHALGIATTRALAVVSTGESVLREQQLPGAILTRVAASHIRVGTFEFFAARGDTDGTRILADYVIERHYRELRQHDKPYLALLDAVIGRQAALIAAWMHVGFIHGVMNTDNMAVSGETIDFGPCAFMDSFDAAAVFSSIDRHGRYAYGNQPHAALWNLSRFAETLLPLVHENAERAMELATELIESFTPRFTDAFRAGWSRKLGLGTSEDGDSALAEDLLSIMQRGQADFTLTLRALCDAAEEGNALPSARALFTNGEEFDGWMARWKARLAREGTDPVARAMAMREVNPAYIPRNHRIQQMIEAAEGGDFAPFERLSTVLSQPHRSQAAFASYAHAPQASERVLRTFCGT
jgi:serine/tyrosine/threonine adenylyltransferase